MIFCNSISSSPTNRDELSPLFIKCRNSFLSSPISTHLIIDEIILNEKKKKKSKDKIKFCTLWLQ